MLSALVLACPAVAFDTSTLICIIESGEAVAILTSVGKPLSIATAVVRETGARRVSELTTSGLLTIAGPTSDDERADYVDLARRLDDGEAMTGALALRRGWAVALDDNRALQLFRRMTPPLVTATTPDILRHWAEVAVVPRPGINAALRRIELSASYTPGLLHPQYTWWQAHRL